MAKKKADDAETLGGSLTEENSRLQAELDERTAEAEHLRAMLDEATAAQETLSAKAVSDVLVSKLTRALGWQAKTRRRAHAVIVAALREF